MTNSTGAESPNGYRIAPLPCRPWLLNGISARLIESHYEHEYGAAVRRLNAAREELRTLDPATASPVALQRLKRDELDALNSTILHELYFASLGGDGRAVPSRMEESLRCDFGSVSAWRNEFVGMAESLAGGSGWALLSYLPRDGRLINHCSTERSPAVVGGIPVLVLDMFEHAYAQEFGPNATAYIAAFVRNIDWTAVQARYDNAVNVVPARVPEQNGFSDLPSISPEEVRSLLDAGAPVHVIDVRPRHYATRSHEIVEGAMWRDPERVDEWIGELPKDEPVVTFCVYGFHIGCETAARLRKAGIDARYMSGGHFAWKAMRGRVKLFEY